MGEIISLWNKFTDRNNNLKTDSILTDNRKVEILLKYLFNGKFSPRKYYFFYLLL